ncbi:type I secretion system permease/ATPase [Methylobacterium tarhaniae]|uniref:type I secretion system permease/ATPase n=1 Tax=Methylobacterium tarhaniae TaxID=1187852 RepID=UPI003D003A30
MSLLRTASRPRTEVETAFQACRPSLALVFCLSFFVNLMALTVPLYLLQVYEHVLSSRSLDTLIHLTLIVVVALAVHAVLEVLRREMLACIGDWLEERLQPAVMTGTVAAAMRGDPTAASQAWRDLGNVRSFFSGNSVTALFDLPWTPIFILAMVLVHPLLGLIGLVGSLVLFLFALINELVTRKPFARASATTIASQHRLEAMLRNAEAISAMGMLPGVARALHNDHDEAKIAQDRAGRRASIIQACARFVRLLTQVSVLAAAAWLVISSDLSAGAIFPASMLLGRALGPVESAIGTWKAVTTVRLGYGRLQKILAAVPARPKGMSLPKPKGALSVEQVSYIPRGSDTATLRRVTITVEPGEVLGVVGPSGAGKSTLGRLIAGTIRPNGGHVRLDGADIGIWLSSGGHRHLGYLPQDVELFAGTVCENIARLGEADSKDVIAAAALVGLHETIMRLPQGYDTDIGEDGARLSGGQKQRLGLARAFFGDPSLVVLDEPNAALDPEGEMALREAIGTLRTRGTTVIVIAQRLGILSVADKVLVLDNGCVNAFGARRDVVARIKDGRTAIPVRKPDVITVKSTGNQEATPADEPKLPRADMPPLSIA